MLVFVSKGRTQYTHSTQTDSLVVCCCFVYFLRISFGLCVSVREPPRTLSYWERGRKFWLIDLLLQTTTETTERILWQEREQTNFWFASHWERKEIDLFWLVDLLLVCSNQLTNDQENTIKLFFDKRGEQNKQISDLQHEEYYHSTHVQVIETDCIDPLTRNDTENQSVSLSVPDIRARGERE